MSLIVVVFMAGLGFMLETWVYERNEQELHRIAEVTKKAWSALAPVLMKWTSSQTVLV